MSAAERGEHGVQIVGAPFREARKRQPMVHGRMIVRLACSVCAVLPGVVTAGADWASEDEASYTILSDGYRAVCSKSTGLCDFYDANNRLIYGGAGEGYVGLWTGRPFLPVEYGDAAWVLRSLCPVVNSQLAVDGDDAVLTLTQESADVRFASTYSFNRLSTCVPYRLQITYLNPLAVTNEIIRTTLAYDTTVVDAFEPPSLVNSVQLDSMDATTGWTALANTTLEAETGRLKEGNGCLKVTFNDNSNGSVDWPGIYRSFAPVSVPTATHLSFWVYPEQRMRLLVYVRQGGAYRGTYTFYFEPGCWTLFEWDFHKTGWVANNVDWIRITAGDQGDSFSGPQAVAYIDDIRLSDDIQNGLHLASTNCDSWWGWTTQCGTINIDESTYVKGQGALRWSNLDLSQRQYLQLISLLGSNTGNDRLPSDLSSYDWLVLHVRSDKQVTIDTQFSDWAYRSVFRSGGFSIPPNTWVPVIWNFKDSDCASGSAVDWSRITSFLLNTRPLGGGTATVWIDDVRLVGLSDDHLIFDAARNRFNTLGRAVKFSTRQYKGPGGTVFGDGYGASNVEAMEFNPDAGSLDAFMRHVDFHTVSSWVNRDGVELGGYSLTHYKEQTRTPGETVQGRIVYELGAPPPVEVVKSRYPRAHRMGYTISDDDFYLKASRAFYCGTSDTTSPDYAKKGVIGHNLLTSKNVWYYLSSNPDGGGPGTYLDNPEVKQFYDFLYQHGIELAMHTPGSLEDKRPASLVAIDDFARSYGCRQFVDHSQANNPEALLRRGLWRTINGAPNDTDDGNYLFDYLQQYNFDIVWCESSSFVPPGANCNLFGTYYVKGWPLPHDNQILGTNSLGRPILNHFRSRGGGQTEFLARGGGGNIDELNEILANEGLVIVYTHSHIGFYHPEGSHYVLNNEPESVFAWLEGQQDAGAIWVDTVARIVDWLGALEKVEITSRAAGRYTVENRNSESISGVTLKVLDGTIRSAKIGERYLIYVTDGFVVLPALAGGEQSVVEIQGGTYESWLPRLTYVDAHVDVLRADYDALRRTARLVATGTTQHDVNNKRLTVQYDESPGFDVKVDGAIVAMVRNGVTVHADPNYQFSYDPGPGILSLRLPTLSANTIVIGPPEPPNPASQWSSDFDQDGDVDRDDLAFFDLCATGPGIPQLNPACWIADCDADGDVDHADFAAVQLCVSGPGVPPGPACQY